MMQKRGPLFFAGYVLLMIWILSCKSASSESSQKALYAYLMGSPVNSTVPATDNFQSWYGIPYARPPVGNLRWKAPVPPSTPWNGDLSKINNLGTFPPQCPQIGHIFGGPGSDKQVVGNEDCLYLNVFAPRYKENIIPQGADRLPVLVWIHGGGNVQGWSGSYDGSTLVEKYNILVVTINYRLGPFGWMSHPALRLDGTDEDKSGNYGTLDTVLAVKWVKDNIGYFGGNPDNITIAGQSAGGFNVLALLATPLAKGLFSKAISMSGYMELNTVAKGEEYYDSTHPDTTSKYSSREKICRLLMNDGTCSTYEEARTYQDGMSVEAIAAYLKGKSMNEIIEAYRDETNPMYMSIIPAYTDGKVLQAGDYTAQIQTSPDFNHVPVILSTTLEETKVFTFLDSSLTTFYNAKDPVYYTKLNRYITLPWKYVGSDSLARSFTQYGDSVYVYRFDWNEEGTFYTIDFSTSLGAFHTADIPFVFGNLQHPLGMYIFNQGNYESVSALGEKMRSYLVEFLYNDKPGKGRSANAQALEWTAWDNAVDGNKFMIFDTDNDPGTGVRMSAEEVTKTKALHDLADDGSLTSPQKCTIFNAMATATIGAGVFIGESDRPTFEGAGYLNNTCP